MPKLLERQNAPEPFHGPEVTFIVFQTSLVDVVDRRCVGNEAEVHAAVATVEHELYGVAVPRQGCRHHTQKVLETCRVEQKYAEVKLWPKMI